MTLPTFSQSRSNDSSMVTVPRQSVINALKMKNDFELYKITSRDSINVLTQIVSSQDSLITTKTETNKILTSNIDNLNQTVVLKDGIIGEKDKVIKKVKSNNKKIIGGGTILIILALLI
jgi:hypothetical protein